MPRFLKIGQLAKETDLSVRALHHYDEIGLLKPSERSDSGYRIYNEVDIKRLHRILALRGVGLSLEEIGNTLEEPIQLFQEKLDRQMEELENEILEKQKLFSHLKKTSQYIMLKDNVELNEIILVIKHLSLMEEYYSPDQLEIYSDLEKKLASKGKEFLNRLPPIIKGVRQCMVDNIPPADIRVQNLMDEWQTFNDMIGLDDAKELSTSTHKLIIENSAVQELTGVDSELLDYVKKIKKATKED